MQQRLCTGSRSHSDGSAEEKGARMNGALAIFPVCNIDEKSCEFRSLGKFERI
jgi:hypothetical protein